MASYLIAQVGIDTPLRKTFDYRIPAELSHVRAGMRVQVPFGRRNVVGLVVHLSNASQVSAHQLKSLQTILDTNPLLDQQSLTLIEWAANYYQFPIGTALFSALPPLLRKANKKQTTLSAGKEFRWLVVAGDVAELQRAPKQAAIYRWLQSQVMGASATELNQQFPNCSTSLRGLEQRGFISREIQAVAEEKIEPHLESADKAQLSHDQSQIGNKLCSTLGSFAVHLLEGVTGSGKTEVYFKAIEQVLADHDGQILILVPEIGLAPQMLQRLKTHFAIPIGVLHSSIREAERKKTWLRISNGELNIILGTRLAAFTPIPNLQLIIVDEEHDASFKQQEGFLYHARDVAIYRAQKLKIPIVLGSATPSFESLHNVNVGKYQHHLLAKRARSATMPTMHLADMRSEPASNILSTPLTRAMHKHLSQGNQVILFLNRRGYSPALLCHDCSWVAQCKRCDANLTYHAQAGKMVCHHCDSTASKPIHCPNCSSSNLIPIGHGTQRIEEVLEQQFSSYSQVRLDRDVTRHRGTLEKILTGIRELQHQIIIGTQILSKGHDFPNVSLVGVLDVDYGIFSSDYRALERTAQLLVQVAGRSGRRDIQGEVVVQTHAPDHPLLNVLLNSGYPTFAHNALELRAEWNLPPYSYQIALRSYSQKPQDVSNFLGQAKQLATQFLPDKVQIIGPISPNMERKAGQYRAHLLLNTKNRNLFGKNLAPWLDKLAKIPVARKVRWNIDVDPIDNI